MKATKASALRELSASELETKIKEARRGLYELKVRKETRQLENAVSVRHSRREIARMETIATQKKKAAAQPAAK